MRWQTRLTQHFPCTVPLIGAPMADHSGAELAVAVCQAGGLGFIAAGHLQDVEQLESELQKFPVALYPLCLGFIGHSVLADAAGWDRYEYVLQRYRPAVVQFFAPGLVRHPVQPGVTNVMMAHSVGAKVFAQVGTLAEAVAAVQEGHVDGVMVQGGEAGGHGLRRGWAKGTLPLARSVVRRVREWQRPDLPVVAAGGVVDGAGLAAVLALGCDGAMLGTRLAATPESQGAFAATLADPAVTCDDVIRTTVLDAIQNEYSTTPWPVPYDSVGAVRNRTVRQWEEGTTNDDDDNNDLRHALRDPVRGPAIVADYRRQKHLANHGMVHCGQGVGDIEKVEPAAALIERISNEAVDILRTLAQTIILPDDDGDDDEQPGTST